MKDFAADIYTELFPTILRLLAIPILVVTFLYGVATQDAQKAGQLFWRISQVISWPVQYSILAPLRDLPSAIQDITHQKP